MKKFNIFTLILLFFIVIQQKIVAQCVGQSSISVMVYNTNPTAAFTANVNNLTVTLNNTSTQSESYVWNFGDGTTSTETNPVHVYSNSGPYQVSLTASNPCGSNSQTQLLNNVAVVNNSFVSLFELSPNPNKGNFILKYSLKNPNLSTVSITNILGQTVYEKTNYNNLGVITMPINISDLPKGNYFISIISQNFTTSHKFILN